MSNVIRAVFGKNAKEIKTEPLFQYDYGQILIIEGIDLPTAYQVHFSNEPYGSSTTSIGGADGVEIPDAYLQSGADVYAWLFLQTGESDGRTVAMIRIPVKARAEITNDEPTEVQQGEIDQLIAALNDAVDDAEDSAEDAEDSAEDAADSAEDAEAWAQGTRGGEPVGSTDPAYHKNAKYYSEQAAQYDPDGKIDKVTTATSGNFASFTSGGGLQDSGHKHSDYLTAHQDISGKANLTVIAPAFAEGMANDAGSFVTYTDGKVYFLENGHTAGTSWANTTKAETNIGAQVGALKNALNRVVVVQDQTPTSEENKIWMMETAPQTVQVPSYSEFEALANEVNGKYEKPSSGIPASDLAEGVIPTEPTWELIASVTVSENTSELQIITDSNGNPFELNEMFVLAQLEPSTTSAQDYVLCDTYAKNASDSFSWKSGVTLKYASASAKTYFMYRSEFIFGNIITFAKSGTSFESSQNALLKSVPANFSETLLKSINGIRLKQYNGTSTLIPKDSIIKVYGIRK